MTEEERKQKLENAYMQAQINNINAKTELLNVRSTLIEKMTNKIITGETK